MTRTVGTRDRTEIETDPQRAWHRGRELDRLLASTRLPYPRGVIRASHRVLNELDDQRALEMARRVNQRPD